MQLVLFSDVGLSSDLATYKVQTSQSHSDLLTQFKYRLFVKAGILSVIFYFI